MWKLKGSAVATGAYDVSSCSSLVPIVETESATIVVSGTFDGCCSSLVPIVETESRPLAAVRLAVVPVAVHSFRLWKLKETTRSDDK